MSDFWLGVTSSIVATIIVAIVTVLFPRKLSNRFFRFLLIEIGGKLLYRKFTRSIVAAVSGSPRTGLYRSVAGSFALFVILVGIVSTTNSSAGPQRDGDPRQTQLDKLPTEPAKPTSPLVTILIGGAFILILFTVILDACFFMIQCDVAVEVETKMLRLQALATPDEFRKLASAESRTKDADSAREFAVLFTTLTDKYDISITGENHWLRIIARRPLPELAPTTAASSVPSKTGPVGALEAPKETDRPKRPDSRHSGDGKQDMLD